MRNTLPAICAALVLLLGIAWAADGPAGGSASRATQPYQIDPAKEKDLRKLLGMMSWPQQAASLADGLVRNFKEAYPEVEPKFWEGTRKEIDSNVLFEMLVPVFAANLDQDEIRAMINFFETPIGRKIAAAQLPMAKDTQQVAHKWGQYTIKQVQEKLRDHLSRSATQSASVGAPGTYRDSADLSIIRSPDRMDGNGR
jgi:hypothetical protein